MGPVSHVSKAKGSVYITVNILNPVPKTPLTLQPASSTLNPQTQNPNKTINPKPFCMSLTIIPNNTVIDASS